MEILIRPLVFPKIVANKEKKWLPEKNSDSINRVQSFWKGQMTSKRYGLFKIVFPLSIGKKSRKSIGVFLYPFWSPIHWQRSDHSGCFKINVIYGTTVFNLLRLLLPVFSCRSGVHVKKCNGSPILHSKALWPFAKESRKKSDSDSSHHFFIRTEQKAKKKTQQQLQKHRWGLKKQFNIIEIILIRCTWSSF